MTRAAVSILMLRLIGAGLTYVFVVAMSRVMTVADFGILGTVMAASQFLSVVGSLGQQLALIRFVPPLLADGRARAAHDIVARAAKLTVGANLLLWLALAAAVLVAESLGRLDRGVVIAFGLLLVPLTGAIDLQASLTRSYKLIILAIGPKDVFWRTLSLVAAGAFLLATHTTRLPLFACFAIMVGMMLALIVGTQLVAQSRYGLPSVHELRAAGPERPVVERWRAARVPLWLVSVSSMAMGNVDVIVTALLLGPEAAGIYFAANRIAFAPLYFQQSFNIVIGPILSELHEAEDKSAAQRAARSAALQIFLPTFVATAGLAFASGLVLGLFGPVFQAAFPILCVLLAATLANTAFGPVDMVLNMCGEERLSMHIGIATLIVGTAFIAALGHFAGAMGIAVGVLVSTVARRWMQWWVVERKLGMRLDVASALLGLMRPGVA